MELLLLQVVEGLKEVGKEEMPKGEGGGHAVVG